MFIAKLLIIQVIVFAGLLFFLRYILTRSITKATSHLEELSDDYTKKQEETKKGLEAAQKESDRLLADAMMEVAKYKSKSSQEAQQEKDKIIQEAHEKGEQMIKQAEKTCALLKKEIEDKISGQATEKAAELLQGALPDKFQRELHDLWFKESLKSGFQLERLNLPKSVKEAKVISVFPLTEEQKKEVKNKLSKKLGSGITLKEKVDPQLIAGIVIMLGSVVIDGSLKYKIQQKTK